MKRGEIKALFLDIGGVLLTNGWGHVSRAMAAEKFGLDLNDMEERHEQIFDAFELGKITLDEYLKMVIFHEYRDFSVEKFKDFMFEQSMELKGHIGYFKQLKNKYGLKVIAVSNEGRELNEYRIKTFNLDELFDAYISSCYVHLHKPDKDILAMACDVAHILPEHALYIDDSCMLADLATSFGILSLHFEGLGKTREFMKTCRFYKEIN